MSQRREKSGAMNGNQMGKIELGFARLEVATDSYYVDREKMVD